MALLTGEWNCRRPPRPLVRESEDIVVTGNLCTDEREGEKEMPAYGIAEEKGSDHNIITSNNCRGNRKSGVLTAGKGAVNTNNVK
ncbi:MAG: hypothetical protein GXP25_16020 [Planctomycetes bacterium]|nr:hypothetical protein [Planctomycetota bacterium]